MTMMQKTHKKIVCVIPARLESTRFPRKILSLLCGRPLLEWVWKAARSVDLFDEIVFAVDSQITADLVTSFGAKYFMTSVSCKCGTDRLIELFQNNELAADIWVNWQGDEPFIVKQMIVDLLQSVDEQNGEMWTLKTLIQNPQDIFAINIAKVVCDKNGLAMYFSRSPIPCFRDERDAAVLIAKKIYYKHVGLYAFTSQALHKIATMGSSDLEDAEKLEQLRFLDYGLRIKVHQTQHEVFGIDVPDDLVKAEKHAKNVLEQKQSIKNMIV
jgi:3-deoxy-manno-octulosonate cytidylyltransferase (CMP-KDO synthetase)